MKGSRLLPLVIAVILAGTLGGIFFNQNAARNVSIPQSLEAMQTKSSPVAWRHKEIPVTAVDSKFIIYLPAFSSGSDWIVGVKPVSQDQSHRMLAGIFTWEDAIDKEGKAKGKGFKRVSKMEDYPRHAASFSEGMATFTDVLDEHQTLEIYLEVAPTVDVYIFQDGKEFVLKASEGSSMVFDGEKESVELLGPASLSSALSVKKIRKEVTKANKDANRPRKEKP